MTEVVTDTEGGDWVPFHEFKGRTIHSIRFIGGHEWDAVNGWRNTAASSTSGRKWTCRKSALRDAPRSYERVDDVRGSAWDQARLVYAQTWGSKAKSEGAEA